MTDTPTAPSAAAPPAAVPPGVSPAAVSGSPGRALAGRVALVTGASRGIGAATARALAGAGAHVIMTARTVGGLEEVEEAIHAAGGQASLAPLDLLDGAGIDRLGAAVRDRFGRLDIAVLSAAMLGSLTPVAHADPPEVAAVFALNVLAQQRLIRALDPALRAAPAGRLVALTSSVATAPRPYWGIYAASKAALEMRVDCWAEEAAALAPVRAAILNPGATRTAMRAKAYPGEDPASLKPPEAVAGRLLDQLVADFPNRARLAA
jgi:NAD(P)-dependent dehydrogenase (short-subunit alcohol dehydrogenase family)